jgi:hypothetical protein
MSRPGFYLSERAPAALQKAVYVAEAMIDECRASFLQLGQICGLSAEKVNHFLDYGLPGVLVEHIGEAVPITLENFAVSDEFSAGDGQITLEKLLVRRSENLTGKNRASKQEFSRIVFILAVSLVHQLAHLLVSSANLKSNPYVARAFWKKSSEVGEYIELLAFGGVLHVTMVESVDWKDFASTKVKAVVLQITSGDYLLIPDKQIEDMVDKEIFKPIDVNDLLSKRPVKGYRLEESAGSPDVKFQFNALENDVVLSSDVVERGCFKGLEQKKKK